MRIGDYWNENNISQEVKNRINSIIERLNAINFDKEKIDNIADDDIPKRLLKSFLPFKAKNPLKGLNTYQACYAIYNRHSEPSVITQWKTSNAITQFLNNFKQHSLRNPIVEQVVTETLRLVHDIWNYYGNGEASFFDEIHVELGREMKNDKKKRERISKQNIENENTNQRIRALLQELKDEGYKDVKPYSPSQQELLKIYEEGVAQAPNVKYDKLSEQDVAKIRRNSSPTKNEITKYKLWLEQGYISPYTGQIIPLSRLFTSDYQIEHIIPQSRYFDNSMGNKVICESEVNKLKDNQTALEFVKNHGGEKVDLGQGKSASILSKENYESHCEKYFKNNRTKLKNLLSEDIPEGFINRQMNDSRYISKLIKGLLSNIVREENENEATSKKLLPVSGAITSKLKQDWGLHDKWNEIIAPRFQRMNTLTNSNDYGYWDEKINAFRIQVPEELKRGFSKKRIDHRHHALDALVIACTQRKHIQYLNSLANKNKKHELRKGLLIQNKQGDYTKHFVMPWKSFTTDAKNTLAKTIISFKQNIRVINKTNNKTWQWVLKDGHYKKQLVKQTKGENWAIRRAMHDPMPYGKIELFFDVLDISKNINKAELIIDSDLRENIKSIYSLNNNNISQTQKYLKTNPIIDENGNIISKTYYKIKNVKYGKRQNINYLSEKKYKQIIGKIYKVADYKLQLELRNHLNKFMNDPEKAFSVEGINIFNDNRLKNGLNPVHNLRIVETSDKRFRLGDSIDTRHKMMEATDGNNLFFAIYWNEKKKKRAFDSVPLNEVIEHQKQVANFPKEKRTLVPINSTKGNFLFSISPNDLVYVPTDEELENPSTFDFSNLTKEQVQRIYKMVSCTGNRSFFILNNISKVIYNKFEYGSLNKIEKDVYGNNIKERCWKLKVDRLGNIINVIKHKP